MHEFSIVQNIVDIVTESAISHKVKQVTCVEVEVGRASGVIREALEFAWESAIQGTLLNRATLKIKDIPLLLQCKTCSRQYQPDDIFDSCPGCGDVSPEVITGKELRVVAIET